MLRRRRETVTMLIMACGRFRQRRARLRRLTAAEHRARRRSFSTGLLPTGTSDGRGRPQRRDQSPTRARVATPQLRQRPTPPPPYLPTTTSLPPCPAPRHPSPYQIRPSASRESLLPATADPTLLPPTRLSLPTVSPPPPLSPLQWLQVDPYPRNTSARLSRYNNTTHCGVLRKQDIFQSLAVAL